MQWLIDAGMLCLGIAVLPQIWRTIKNRKDLKDIDFKFASLTMFGNILAIIWGFIVQQWSILLLNVVYLIWSVLSLYWMVKNR